MIKIYNIWLRKNNRDRRLRIQRERNRETRRILKGRLMYVRHEEIEIDICNIENKRKMTDRHNKNGSEVKWRKRRTRKRRKREVRPHRYTSFVTVLASQGLTSLSQHCHPLSLPHSFQSNLHHWWSFAFSFFFPYFLFLDKHAQLLFIWLSFYSLKNI